MLNSIRVDNMSRPLPFVRTLSKPIPAALVLVLIAVCNSCTSANHSKLPIGYVDVPAPGRPAVFNGNSVIEGWALSDGGIQQVAIYIDRQYVSSTQTDIPRPDVATAYPKESHGQTSGWRAPVDVTNLAVGSHDVVVQATGKNGAKRDIGAFQATVVK